ncbi:MAG: hypothetical protein OEZ20_07670, partial [candidate division WOR-3 bacterium]|nr:hypothetical protein [candidate division WOR-3 bacterium]
MRFKKSVPKYLIGMFFAIGLSFANPVPDINDTLPKSEVWDNLFGTAGEPLFLYDIYLVGPKDFRTVILFDPINTESYWDSLGKKQPDLPLYRISVVNRYSRINLPVSFAYGISRFFEIEFRRAFVTRSSLRTYFPLPESMLVQRAIRDNTEGLGDFSVRIRTKILGEQDKPLYLATGAGLKIPTSPELDVSQHLPLNPGSIDIFFGIYNVIKIGPIKFPNALTYSHTGRYHNGLSIGELITYRFGLIAKIFRLADLNLSLKGFEITEESEPADVNNSISMSSGITDKITEISPQGISKTTAEFGLSIKIPKIQAILSGGVSADLRGKRTYKDDISSIFSLQLGF